MKRLKFNVLNKSDMEVLTREQLKNVLGGSESTGSGNKNCGFKTTSGRWVEVVDKTNSENTKDEAIRLSQTTDHYYEVYGNGFEVDLGTPTGNWCCDSCPW